MRHRKIETKRIKKRYTFITKTQFKIHNLKWAYTVKKVTMQKYIEI